MDQGHDWQRMLSPAHNYAVVLLCSKCRDWRGDPEANDELSIAPPKIGPCSSGNIGWDWEGLIDQLVPWEGLIDQLVPDNAQYSFTVTSLF